MGDGAIKPTSSEIVSESSRREERARAKDKGESSQFDEVLRQRAQIGQPSAILKQAAQTATEQAVRQERPRDEGDGRKGDREKGEEREGKSGGEGEKRSTDAKTAEQRVVAKHGLKDRDSGGQSGERGHGGGGFMGRRDTGGKSTRQLSSSHTPVQLRAQFARNLAKAARMPENVFTQHVLNQIVRYVRIGINAEGEKEMRLELHEKIFRGVRLRVSTKGKGKVVVHFTTSDAEAREAFMKQRDAIRGALAKKGIEVAEITIT